jgi:hypothetical protein
MKIKQATTILTMVLVSGCVHVPRDMVAFFNTDACPAGWAAVSGDWNGRYVVIGNEGRGRLVGEALSPGENRVTGDHGHAGDAIRVRTNVDNASADDDHGWNVVADVTDSATPRNAGETVKPGTNAPYVKLRACAKS